MVLNSIITTMMPKILPTMARPLVRPIVMTPSCSHFPDCLYGNLKRISFCFPPIDDEQPTFRNVGIIRREPAPEDAVQSVIDRNEMGILRNSRRFILLFPADKIDM